VLKLDHALMERIGLGELPSAEKQAYLRAFYERLQLAVGKRLADRMSDEQLTEFERLVDGSDELARAWLHVNFPEYRRFCHEEFDRLSAELAEQASQIVSLEAAYARS
jgi:hypothetical protein